MRRLCQEALSAARSAGASYTDVRIITTTYQTVHFRQGQGRSMDQGETIGVGVRARVVDSWGFAAGTEISLPGVRQTAQRAVELAEASGLIFPLPRRLAPVEPIEAEWRTSVRIDPFSVTPQDKTDLLLATRTVLRGAPAVREISGRIHASRELKSFASSEGSYIEQERTVVGAGYEAIAIGRDGFAIRSFPQALGGQFQTGGYELIEPANLVDSAIQIRDEATRLLSAPPCPEGVFDLVLSGPVVAVLLHETCGHPAELDRVLDREGDPPGASFVGPDDLDLLRYGSGQVTIDANATEPGALGSFGFDDEGVPARTVRLVDRGTWSGFLGNRETASVQHLDRFAGFARASGFIRTPLIRMANVSLAPGTWRLDELVVDTHRGYLLDTPVHLAVDRSGRHFVCQCEVGWEIRGGRLEQLVKGPVFAGDAISFWQSCDAICDQSHYTAWGFPGCIKGDPPQLLSTGHGASPVRFRGVRLGPTPWGFRP